MTAKKTTPLYKVLDAEGKSCHGGTLTWSLPKGSKSGRWHKVADPVKCSRGLHLTTDPVRWPHLAMRVFLAEAGDDVTEPDSDAKVVTGQARLIRELTDDELAALRVFRSGTHEVKDATCIALGSSTVTALGSSTVTALGSSTVTASGSSTVRASGSSTVRASGSSTVTALGSSTVTASGSSTVICHYGTPKVSLEGTALFADHRVGKVT